jgi:hypothetical protein
VLHIGRHDYKTGVNWNSHTLCLSHSISHSRTLSHTLSHTLCLSHSISHPHSLPHAHVRRYHRVVHFKQQDYNSSVNWNSLSLCISHSISHLLTHSLFRNVSHTHSHDTLAHSHNLAHSHTLARSLTLAHSLTLVGTEG